MDPLVSARRAALSRAKEIPCSRAAPRSSTEQGAWIDASAARPLQTSAAARPQVSVRKAALVALGRLLELLPLEPPLCAAWVRSALPLVRDPESTIQEALLEWAQALLLDRAAAAGAAAAAAPRGRGAAGGGDEPMADAEAGGNGEGDAAAPAAAAGELRPLLAAVAGVGRAAGACLGKVCAALSAKRKLASKKVAKGLEAFVAGEWQAWPRPHRRRLCSDTQGAGVVWGRLLALFLHGGGPALAERIARVPPPACPRRALGLPGGARRVVAPQGGRGAGPRRAVVAVPAAALGGAAARGGRGAPRRGWRGRRGARGRPGRGCKGPACSGSSLRAPCASKRTAAAAIRKFNHKCSRPMKRCVAFKRCERHTHRRALAPQAPWRRRAPFCSSSSRPPPRASRRRRAPRWRRSCCRWGAARRPLGRLAATPACRAVTASYRRLRCSSTRRSHHLGRREQRAHPQPAPPRPRRRRWRSTCRPRRPRRTSRRCTS